MSNFWDGSSPHSIICIGNVLRDYTATQNATIAPLLADFITTTIFYGTSSYIQVDAFCDEQYVDFVALGPANYDTGQLSIQIQLLENGSYSTIQGRSYVDGLKDNSPAIIAFTKRKITGVRLILSSSASGVKTSLSTLSAGLRIDLPKTPDVGFSPGRYNILDVISNGQSEGGAFGPARVLTRLSEEIATFSDLGFDFIDQELPRLYEWRGYPIFFSYDMETAPFNCIFGRWELPGINYANVNHGGLNLVITGNV